MAPNNIFKQKLHGTPTEALNWRLWYCVLTFGLMGAARGLDEGLISSTVAQKSFIAEFKLKDPHLSKAEQASRLGNITSMVQVGSILGAMVAFLLCDKIGRVWATRQLCVTWIVGIIIYITSTGNLGQLYAGRFIAGVGIGATTVVAPTYLAEIAPRAIRGLTICCFSGSVYLGIMLGYFASWGASIHISNNSAKQWIIPTTLHIMFAGIILILSFAVKESPRYLMKVKKTEQAEKNMCWIRQLPADHAYVQTELYDIRDQLEREAEATANVKWAGLGVLKEIFSQKSNRYRMMLAFFAQVLGQWSGGGSITIYAPEFFALLGVTGQSEKLFATAIFGVVKFVAAICCALFLVDFIGRKRALGAGITLQFVTMLYVGLYLTLVPSVADTGAKLTVSQKHAGTGAIVMIYFSGVGWALGWNSIQYLINAEMFPLRLRSFGSAFAMVVHFAMQYGSSKAVPEMLVSGLKPQGTFLFFAAVTLLGGLWVWLFLPELAGKPLESMDELFNLPWYLIGRKGAQLTAGSGSMAAAVDVSDPEKVKAEMVENA